MPLEKWLVYQGINPRPYDDRIMSPKDVVIYPDFGYEGLPEFIDKVFDFMAEL